MTLLLEIVEGARQGSKVTLSGPIEAGREEGVALVLRDEEVSRHHARIEPDGDGAVVHDLGSTNGTYVNEQPVSGAQRLSPGDRVRMGLTVLELRTEQQVARQPSVVGPAPQITQLGADVLRPARAGELAPVEEPGASVPGFMIEESEPAFVPRSAIEADGGGASRSAASSYGAIGKLFDTRVKRQTQVAAFAVLSLAGLAVLIFFGVR
jgi:hypothetical protein